MRKTLDCWHSGRRYTACITNIAEKQAAIWRNLHRGKHYRVNQIPGTTCLLNKGQLYLTFDSDLSLLFVTIGLHDSINKMSKPENGFLSFLVKSFNVGRKL